MLDPHDLPTIKAALRIAASMIGHDRTPYIETLLRIIDNENTRPNTDRNRTGKQRDR